MVGPFCMYLQVRLKVKPLQAGILKVTGVKWTLAGIAKGQRDFEVLGLKKRKSRSNKRDEPVPDQRLKFHVLGVCFLSKYLLHLRTTQTAPRKSSSFVNLKFIRVDTCYDR